VREVTFVRDERLNELPGVGAVRFTSPWGNKAVGSAPGHPEWHLSGRVMYPDVTHVADQTGMEIATVDLTRRAIEYGRRTLILLGAWGANQIAAIKMAAAGTTPAT
jgi:hypothetical protein